MCDNMDAGIIVNIDVPVYRNNPQNVEIHVNPDRANPTEAGALVNAVIQNAYDSVRVQRREAKEEQEMQERQAEMEEQAEQQRRSLKRRRTDEDLQRDRRQRPNENVDFSIVGVNSTTHFRMRRSDTLFRSLQRFAESRGKAFCNLRLFYQGNHVRSDCTADDIGMESGESIEVYELVD